MNIHEYQSKQILKWYGINVLTGNRLSALKKLPVSLKTWVLGGCGQGSDFAGGRGKAGGVKLAHNIDEVKYFASQTVSKRLVTHQTGPERQGS